MKPIILYVDDEPINLELFEILFEDKFKIITADSGYQGLDKLKLNNDISIVISDMKMPEMNGLEFIGYARNLFPNKTYIILTGYDITIEIINALKNNIIHKYLCKPFDLDSIRRTLDEVVSSNK